MTTTTDIDIEELIDMDQDEVRAALAKLSEDEVSELEDDAIVARDEYLLREGTPYDEVINLIVARMQYLRQERSRLRRLYAEALVEEGRLHERYRIAHSTDENPEYLAPYHLTKADVTFNVHRLRERGELAHAEALEAFGRQAVR